MQNKFFVWSCAAIMALTVSKIALADIDGSYDHADIPRIAGSSIVYFDRTEFDRVSIPTGPYDGDDVESAETMEGEVLSLSYTFDNPDISTLQVNATISARWKNAGSRCSMRRPTMICPAGQADHSLCMERISSRAGRGVAADWIQVTAKSAISPRALPMALCLRGLLRSMPAGWTGQPCP